MLGHCQLDPKVPNSSEILTKIQNLSFAKMHREISSVKWRRFCPGRDQLKWSIRIFYFKTTSRYWGSRNQWYTWGLRSTKKYWLAKSYPFKSFWPMGGIRWSKHHGLIMFTETSIYILQKIKINRVCSKQRWSWSAAHIVHLNLVFNY